MLEHLSKLSSISLFSFGMYKFTNELSKTNTCAKILFLKSMYKDSCKFG